MKTIESYLPIFTGFYNTVFSSESAEENIVEYLNEEEGEDVPWDDVDFDYKEYRDRVAKTCINSVETFLKSEGVNITITFDGIWSPQYYNFRNDVINCTYVISEMDFQKLVNFAMFNDLGEFQEFLENNYKSYDGFMSFIDHDSETWFSEYLKEDSSDFEIAFEGVLTYFLEMHGYNYMSMYDTCSEECYLIDYELKTETKIL